MNRSNNDKTARQYWWRFLRTRPELYTTIAGMERVLITAQTSRRWEPAFQNLNIVYSHTVVVFSLEKWSDYAVMQSFAHEEWRLTYGPSLRMDARYTPSDCFETFPFPRIPNPEPRTPLHDIGERYYTHRQHIMQTRHEGLTQTYNRFHNPHETAPDIIRLRELHVEMDHAVAAAYGWQDLLPSPSGRGTGGEGLGHGFHDTKQGQRYTISEAARREVLDRLLGR